jgi:hypothetical protein
VTERETEREHGILDALADLLIERGEPIAELEAIPCLSAETTPPVRRRLWGRTARTARRTAEITAIALALLCLCAAAARAEGIWPTSWLRR